MVVDQQPRKLSEWFRQAIADVQACAADGRYRIDMGAWHLGAGLHGEKQNPQCLVCLAGSLLAQTFHTQPTETWDATDDGDGSVPRDVAWLLRAINSARLGDILNAVRAASMSGLCVDQANLRLLASRGLDLLVAVICPDPNRWETPPYEMAMDPFLTSMRWILDNLEALGV